MKRVNFKLLAKAVDTLIILMGLRNLPSIISSLLEGGLEKTTPIAIIEQGFFPDQKFLSATLETVINKVKRENLKPPALIIIGNIIKSLEISN